MPPKPLKPVKTDFWSDFFRHPDPFVEFVWVFFFLLVILSIVNGFVSMIASNNLNFSGLFHGIIEAFLSKWPFVQIFMAILSVALLVGVIYVFRKYAELLKNQKKLLYPEMATTDIYLNTEWQNILDHTESLNENDWRHAILQADIMLGDLLDKLFLPGETMADKLKAVEKSDFTTLDNAWEAHKVRNQIAHSSDFILTQREARRVIGLYETVFKEFKII